MPYKEPSRQTAWNARARASKKALINSLKSGPCTDCGNSYPPHVMDFDRLSDKTEDVAKMSGYRRSVQRIMTEVAKCELVCSNCHRIRTAARQRAHRDPRRLAA